MSDARAAPNDGTTQFYLSGITLNEDLRRCEESYQHRQRITLVGTTEEGKIRAFTGVVQSVEYYPYAAKGRQYCVTISNR